METKYHFFMFCYTWRANGEQGNGSNVLLNNARFINDSDLSDASKYIKEFIGKRMNHNEDAIQVIFTNIIHLNHCTKKEYYGND